MKDSPMLKIVLAVVIIGIAVFGYRYLRNNDAGHHEEAPETARQIPTKPLLGSVLAEATGLRVQPEDAPNWKDCVATIDNEYKAKVQEVGESEPIIPYTEFVNDNGEKFDYKVTQVSTVEIICKNPEGIFSERYR